MRQVIVGKPLAGYPGLHMVDRAEGPRAMLMRSRLRVSDIVRSVHYEHGSDADVAHWLEIEPPVVESAMRYYRDHREQVDGWIREEDEYTERAEAEWLREHGS